MLLLFFSILAAASFKKKILYFVLCAGTLSALAIALNLISRSLGYIESYQNIEYVVATRPWDYNIVVGGSCFLYCSQNDRRTSCNR